MNWRRKITIQKSTGVLCVITYCQLTSWYEIIDGTPDFEVTSSKSAEDLPVFRSLQENVSTQELQGWSNRNCGTRYYSAAPNVALEWSSERRNDPRREKPWPKKMRSQCFVITIFVTSRSMVPFELVMVISKYDQTPCNRDDAAFA